MTLPAASINMAILAGSIDMALPAAGSIAIALPAGSFQGVGQG